MSLYTVTPTQGKTGCKICLDVDLLIVCLVESE